MSMRKRQYLIVCIILFSLNLFISTSRADYPWATQSQWTEIAPIQDGALDPIYSTNGPQIAWYIVPVSAHIRGFNYIYILNDAQFLYLFFDILSDNTTEPDDTLFIFLDTNNNNSQSNDFSFVVGRDQEFIYDYLNYTYDGSPNGVYFHVQWEVRFNLTAFPTALAPGDVIGYLFAVYGTLAPQHFYPANNYPPISWGDESTYNKLRLAASPSEDNTTLTWIIILSASVIGAIIITYLLMRRRA